MAEAHEKKKKQISRTMSGYPQPWPRRPVSEEEHEKEKAALRQAIADAKAEAAATLKAAKETAAAELNGAKQDAESMLEVKVSRTLRRCLAVGRE